MTASADRLGDVERLLRELDGMLAVQAALAPERRLAELGPLVARTERLAAELERALLGLRGEPRAELARDPERRRRLEVLFRGVQDRLAAHRQVLDLGRRVIEDAVRLIATVTAKGRTTPGTYGRGPGGLPPRPVLPPVALDRRI